MSGIPKEFVQWYFSELVRSISRKLGARNWELRSTSELQAEIHATKPEVHKAYESFLSIYSEWAAATQQEGNDPQFMVSLVQKREAHLEALVKAVASAI